MFSPQTLLRGACLAAFALSPAFAQTAATTANPLTAGERNLYEMVRNNLLRAAEKMPEEHYAYKPTPDVRSFGQLMGHVADAQYLFCSAVSGDGAKSPGVEKAKTSKADVMQGLKDGFAYCDKAFGAMTDAQAAQMAKFFGGERTKLSILSFNTVHNMEHYGNAVTYMRLKGLVPPSSEGRR